MPDPPIWDCETGMNLRALTLIVLMATWMVPANGYSCLPDATGVAGHGHEQGVSSHSHAHASDEQSHAHGSQRGSLSHDHVAATTIVDSSERFSETVPRELSSCCESGPDASDVVAAVKNAESRPKSAAAVAVLVIATVPPEACLVTGAQLQRLQPPPLPYEKNRRPLLI